MKKNTKIILIVLCVLIIGIVGGVVTLNHKAKPDNESRNKTKSVVNNNEKNTDTSQKNEDEKKIEPEKKETKKQATIYKNLDEGINAVNVFFDRLDGGKELYKLISNKKTNIDFGKDSQQIYFSANSNTIVAFDVNKSTGECFQVHLSTIMDGGRQCFTDSNVMRFAAIGIFNKDLSDDDIMSTSKKLTISDMILSDEEKSYEVVINGMTYRIKKTKKDKGMYSVIISITKEV